MYSAVRALQVEGSNLRKIILLIFSEVQMNMVVLTQAVVVTFSHSSLLYQT